VIPNRTPPQFSGGAVPLIGQQQAQAQAAIAQAISQLSLAIYSRAASDYLADTADYKKEVNRQSLEKLARQAQEAAQAYFIGLGIVESFEPKPNTNKGSNGNG